MTATTPTGSKDDGDHGRVTGGSGTPISQTVTGLAAVVSVATVLVAAFMDLLDATIVSVSAPTIAQALGASEAALQWTLAGYALAIGAGLITGGRIGDQFGRRRVFLLGMVGFTFASAGCALVSSAEVLIATRVAQGLAAGLMVPQVFGIIRASLAPETRSKALGAYGAVLGLASVAGPLLGGLLVEADLFGLGWRTIFWVNVPVGVAGLLLGARFLPESRSPDGSRLDLAGAALAAIAATLLLLPLVQGRDWGWPWWGFGLLALSIPVTVLFIARERGLVARGGQPILDPSLLRIRAFSGGLTVSLLFFGAIGSFFLLLALYLQLGTGRSALQTGLVILPYAVGSIVTSGAGVALADRAGRVLLISGSLLLAASQVVLWTVVGGGSDPGYWTLALPLFIGGLGVGLAAPPLIDVVLAGVPDRDSGAAGGVLTTTNQVGGAAGVAVLGVVFFGALEASFADGARPLVAYGDALTSILPWQVACYIVAAALMLLLPSRASSSRG